ILLGDRQDRVVRRGVVAGSSDLLDRHWVEKHLLQGLLEDGADLQPAVREAVQADGDAAEEPLRLPLLFGLVLAPPAADDEGNDRRTEEDGDRREDTPDRLVIQREKGEEHGGFPFAGPQQNQPAGGRSPAAPGPVGRWAPRRAGGVGAPSPNNPPGCGTG